MLAVLLFAGSLFCAGSPIGAAEEPPPAGFFFMGDGVLNIRHQKIRFRNGDGGYDESALRKIHQIFNADWDTAEERLSLRFLEMLDYLQDELEGGTYQLRSGYRKPRYNQSLRNKGKLAAQSSMHIEGAAGDFILSGVPSSRVFDFVKGLNCCGIGWYHSRHFHLDTGPARYWDEKTSKTEDKTPQRNEKIILQSDYDRYRPGEVIELKLMRITEFPVGVQATWELLGIGEANKEGNKLKLITASGVATEGECLMLQERKHARSLSVQLPSSGLTPGKYAIKASFCRYEQYGKMPAEILSREFEILPTPGKKN